MDEDVLSLARPASSLISMRLQHSPLLSLRGSNGLAASLASLAEVHEPPLVAGRSAQRRGPSSSFFNRIRSRLAPPSWSSLPRIRSCLRRGKGSPRAARRSLRGINPMRLVPALVVACSWVAAGVLHVQRLAHDRSGPRNK
jgi:hypothetical protein